MEKFINKSFMFLISLSLIFSIIIIPINAYAEPNEDSEEVEYTLTVNNEMIQQYNTWQDQVDSANSSYEEHLKEYEELMANIKTHEEEAKLLKEKIENNQAILSDFIVENYKNDNEESILSVIFESKSFSDFVNNITYIQYIQRPYKEAIIENKELKAEQERLLKELEEDKAKSEEELSKVEASKKEVDEVSERIKKKINGELGLYEAPPVPKEGYSSVIEAGISRLGLPYVWGGKGHDDVTFDCSGLTHWCYEKTYGVNIGWSTSEQYSKADKILPLDQAKPGDVLFRFAEDGSTSYQHVAIYIGKFGNMQNAYLHTPTTGRLSEIRDGIDSFDCALRFDCTGN